MDSSLWFAILESLALWDWLRNNNANLVTVLVISLVVFLSSAVYRNTDRQSFELLGPQIVDIFSKF